MSNPLLKKGLSPEHRREGVTHNHRLEMTILGILLVHGEQVYAEAHKILKPELFDNEANRIVFEEIKRMFENGKIIGEKVVELGLYHTDIENHIDGSAAYYLGQIINAADHFKYFPDMCLRLAECYIEREVLRVRFENQKGDALGQLQKMKNSIDDLLQISATEDWQDISEVSNNLIKRIEDVYKNKETIFSNSGINFIDKVNGGFKKNQFIILASRPGVGKSALAGMIILKVAHAGKKVGIINLEMDNEDILSRMLSAESDIENYKLELGAIMRDELEQKYMLEKLSEMAGLSIKFSSQTKVNINDIRAKALKLHRREGLDFLVIDYIQLINGALKNSTRQEQVADMSRGIKLLAMELKMPILAMAQLNRQGTGSENLRESGALEQDADVVLILERDFDDKIVLDGREFTNAELNIKKYRNASTGKQPMYYEGSRLRFINKEDYERDMFKKPAPVQKEKALFTSGMQPKNDNAPF